jgi:OOP family OmpA-OmpF porin
MKQSYTHIARLLIVTSALVTAVGVQAQSKSNSMYGPGNSYIGLNVGQSDYSLGNGIGVFNSSQGDRAFGINAGSYFNSNLGIELGYTDFGSINRAGGSTKANGINLSLIGKLPLNESFNLLGKIGTTWGSTNVAASPLSGVATGDSSDFGLSYGVGAELVMTPQWSALLKYDSHNLKFAGDISERIGSTTLGLRYRF